MTGLHDIPLYLFAKAPEPGKVKTRMRPQLDNDACAALATRMLVQSASKVVRHWPGPRILCVAPTLDHPRFHELEQEQSFRLLKQIDAGLGDRMLAALADGLEQFGQAVVMGCDVPHIDGAILQQAWRLMQLGDNVIGPAEDGGFYLLGVNASPARAFTGIEWGGDQVASAVLRQGLEEGIAFTHLPTLRDIDRYDDLLWLVDRDIEYGSDVGLDKD